MLGNRALYHDGWVAGCLHGRLPWLTSGGASFDEDRWELYDIEKDFSQANDLAASEPQKLRELQDRFMAEAAKYNVLPLDDRFAQRADPKLHPSHIRGRTKFVYAPGTVRLGERSSPNTKNVHHTLAAEVEIPEGGAEGVLGLLRRHFRRLLPLHQGRQAPLGAQLLQRGSLPRVVHEGDPAGASRALGRSEGRQGRQVRRRRKRDPSPGQEEHRQGALRAAGRRLLHRQRGLRRRLRHGLAGVGSVQIAVSLHRPGWSR
jgi:hypothetical protein